MADPVLHIEGKVATITLARPDRANRLEPSDLAVLISHIDKVNADKNVLVLRIESSGKYFCSGYDIGALGASRGVNFDTMVDAIENARAVTIAVIHGGVYGGGTDLALACDFRIGASHVDMFMPAARLGLHFYRSGLERYVSRLGLDNAKRLFLTAERIDAAQMKAFGFLTDLVDSTALQERADTLTAALSSMAPIALLGMKRHLNAIAVGRLDADALSADIARAAASNDLKEGGRAWAEKRPANFTGQ